MLVREMKPVNSALTPTATYFQGPSGPLYRRDDTQGEGTYADASNVSHIAGKTRWYVYDGLGSVVGEVDPSGSLTSSGTFDVYGAKRVGGSTGAATTKQGFVGGLGHVSDTETGLVYMRARYYDPNIGRFISEDPALDGINWFTYCANNPVNFVDGDGEKIIMPLTGMVEYFTAELATATACALAMASSLDPKSALGKALEIAAEGLAVVGAVLFAASLDSMAIPGSSAVQVALDAYIGIMIAAIKMVQAFGGKSELPGAGVAITAAFGNMAMIIGAMVALDADMASLP